MRVVLIGSPAERAELRSESERLGLDAVGEFDTLSAARAAGLRADAFLLHSPQVDPDEIAPVEALTAREAEVLELLAQGLSNKGIADRLGISDQTVKFHVASIAGKLGAANRTDAVRRAVRRGLIAL
ncbi:MAG TPA: response regulator transcription factor [Vicinamibacterales bacterium]|jgi:DNA-binding NarL/FixJ family response regulator|nr:response regulator transcription factor [Vicinamibacterales bacterium]